MANQGMANRKIPTTVISGFLGAGKTSLIRHVLATANGRRVALIINEFGDLGIDESLLRGCGDDACADDLWRTSSCSTTTSAPGRGQRFAIARAPRG